MSLATVRIDEYRTYAGLADLDVRARVRPTLPSAARATAGGTAR
jgi:hypothetical protein